MPNATQHRHRAPANRAARTRTVSRFVAASIRPLIVQLSRKWRLTYWPGRRCSVSAPLLAMLALLAGVVSQPALAAPQGGQVVAGSATLQAPTGGSTLVTQSSQNAIINWQSFSIGAGETVRFVQPGASAVMLNRVVGSDPSRIFGTLTANGQVFLVNGAGVYFSPGARVDVGALVASSLNITNDNFLAGRYQFTAGAQAGAVSNAGQLRGAFVVLAAPQVSNAGSIVATAGSTALVAGARITLDIAGDQLVNMSVDAAAANAAVLNSGSIHADGGKVFMSARSSNAVLDTVINTSGIVRATSMVERNGQIVLDGGTAGQVHVSGTLAAGGGAAGASGGSVHVLGDQVALLAGAHIDVSGDGGGGSVLVGGALHGAGGVPTAATTRIEQGARIDADALAGGNGGKVVVWADQHASFAGAISARGGAGGGGGGFVETSGKHTLAFSGTVDTSAARGASGTLLLDPGDITIATGASSGGMVFVGGTYAGTAATSTLNVGNLTAALATSNVIVDTHTILAQASAGNITVSTDIAWNSANSLTLKADANITNNAQIVSHGGGAINLFGDGVIAAGTLASSSGAINIAGNAGLATRAGSVIGTSIVSNSGSVGIRSGGAIVSGAITTGTGTIALSGNADVALGTLASGNLGNAAIVVTAGAGSAAGVTAGGDIHMAGGSVMVNGAGQATLYTGSIDGSDGVSAAAGAGSGHFRYNSNPAATRYTSALGSGVNVVYRERPTLTIGAPNASATYGDVMPTFHPVLSGFRNGDTVSQTLSSVPIVSISDEVSLSGNVTAGLHALTPSAVGSLLGYRLAYTKSVLKVDKKALVASGSTALDRPYDGAAIATVNIRATALAFGGAGAGDGKAYAGDSVSINTLAPTAGSFVNKDAGVGKAVAITGLTLQGVDAANYTVTGAAIATITPKVLTATATAADKMYDGGIKVTAPIILTLAGLVGTETLSGAASGVFNSKDVVSADHVTVASVILGNGANGGLASNYQLAPGQIGSAHITPKSLTASMVALDKVYDGNTVAAPMLTITSGLLGGETLGVSSTGAFNSKDVTIADHVTVASVNLSNGANGGLASNYSLAPGQVFSAHITPKTLTASMVAPDKIYDGNTVAAPVLTIESGLVGAETLGVSSTGTFNSKDVDTANTVTVNTVLLAGGANGGLATNYRLPAGQSAAASIARLPSVTWIGTLNGSGDWSNPLNWTNGAIPDRANVANVVIPAGKSVTFNASVATLNGAVQLDGISGPGALTVRSSTPKVASALDIGSYAQSAGEVDAGSLSAAGSFSQSGGKLVVTTLADIKQAGGIVSLGNITTANLAIHGGASVLQAPGSALVVSDTTTLALGDGDVVLGNLNDLRKVVITSARDVLLADINGLEVEGSVARNLQTGSGALVLGPLTVGGNFTATARGAISQSAALTVAGSSSLSAAGQAITLGNAGNDFGGELTLMGGATHVADKNALRLGAGTISGDFFASAQGDVTQAGALGVQGTTSLTSPGAILLANAGNDFVGAVGASARSVELKDQNVLLVSRIDALKADLGAGSALQSIKGGIVSASEIALSLLPTATNGLIGSASNYFQVKPNAVVTLGATMPAVSANFGAQGGQGGQGVQFVIDNPVAKSAYMEGSADLFLNGIRVFAAVSTFAPANNNNHNNSPLAQSLLELQRQAERNASLSAIVPHPHGGLVKAKAPLCEVPGNPVQQECPPRYK
ncbi:MAG: filamentous hemagglutinin N-terminal domain-containing protein [Massilia sp.]|nr:filamentous hemagglutinin N-terminal domain-containing protein [Massilia sp.]